MLGFSPLASAPIGATAATGATLYLSATEAADTAAVAVDVVASASLAVTEAADTASVSVSLTASASLDVTEATDTASGSVSATTFVNLLATEAQDTASGSAQINPAYADLAATEAADTASITTAIVASADLAVTEAQDTASGSAAAITQASLAATEAQDVASFAGQVFDACSFALVEAPDTASIQVGVTASAALIASEAPDSASGGVVVQWAVIPSGPSVWTPQANGEAFWQGVNPALPPSNVTQIGGALGCASIGGAPIAATASPPSGGAIGALWTQPASSVAYWDKITPLQPQANVRPTGALGGAPIGGIAVSDGVADTPTETPGSAVWTPITSSFTPQQQAA
jgi:hypothetical protein